MHEDVLKFVIFHKFLQSRHSTEFSYFTFLIRFCWILYIIFLLFPKLLKLCLLVLICLNIQLPGVVKSSGNTHETNKYLLCDIFVDFGFLSVGLLLYLELLQAIRAWVLLCT
jgi:hypothetical protein